MLLCHIFPEKAQVHCSSGSRLSRSILQMSSLKTGIYSKIQLDSKTCDLGNLLYVRSSNWKLLESIVFVLVSVMSAMVRKTR